jgi:predicted metal-binding protein
MQVTLCAGCPLGRTDMPALLRAALADRGIAAAVSVADCMSGCARGSTVAFRAPGKTAYLFGDLTADDLPDLLTFAALYAASADGTLPDARPLGDLRFKALARIPG